MHVKQRKDGAPLPSPLCCKRGLFLAGETEPTRPPSAPRKWTQMHIFKVLYFFPSFPPFLPGHFGWGSVFVSAATEERSGCLWVREAGKEAAGPLRGSESPSVRMRSCDSPFHRCWRPESKRQCFIFAYLFFKPSAPWINMPSISWDP